MSLKTISLFNNNKYDASYFFCCFRAHNEKRKFKFEKMKIFLTNQQQLPTVAVDVFRGFNESIFYVDCNMIYLQLIRVFFEVIIGVEVISFIWVHNNHHIVFNLQHPGNFCDASSTHKFPRQLNLKLNCFRYSDHIHFKKVQVSTKVQLRHFLYVGMFNLQNTQEK